MSLKKIRQDKETVTQIGKVMRTKSPGEKGAEFTGA